MDLLKLLKLIKVKLYQHIGCATLRRLLLLVDTVIDCGFFLDKVQTAGYRLNSKATTINLELFDHLPYVTNEYSRNLENVNTQKIMRNNRNCVVMSKQRHGVDEIFRPGRNVFKEYYKEN